MSYTPAYRCDWKDCPAPEIPAGDLFFAVQVHRYEKPLHTGYDLHRRCLDELWPTLLPMDNGDETKVWARKG